MALLWTLILTVLAGLIAHDAYSRSRDTRETAARQQLYAIAARLSANGAKIDEEVRRLGADDAIAPTGRLLLLTDASLLDLGTRAPVGFAGQDAGDAARYLRDRLATDPAENTIDDMRVTWAPIAGTSWRLLLVESAADADGAIVRAALPVAGLLVMLLAVAWGSFFMFRRDFLQPAIALVTSAHDPRSPAVVPKINPLWRPLAEQFDRTREEVAQHVASLEEQFQLTNAILQCAIDAIVTADEEGRILDFNPAAETVFGWSAAEVVGRRMDETIIPADLRERHRAGMARYVGGEEARVMGRVAELRGLRRNGEEFPMELAIAEARLDTRRVFIGFMRDLTQRNADEQELTRSRDALHQADKLAALGQLLAGVAHELNNPLAVVVGRSAILAEKLADTPHVAAIGKLRGAADRCARIVRTFLAMARQTGPRRGPTNVNQLAEGVLDMTAYGLRSAGVTLTLDLDPAMPDIEADEDQIVQVLINLVLNAQQALETVDGMRTLTVRTRNEEADRTVMIEVIDSGPGIAPEIAGRIFEPFFTTKDVGQGTGLGLSVCKGVVEAHGGALSSMPTEGGGATFRVTLPHAADAVAVEERGQDRRARARVLIVDDELEVAAMLADCLRPLGASCDIAGDASDALRRIGDRPYDAIFCDPHMPGMDGLAFQARLDADHPSQVRRLAFISSDALPRENARLRAVSGRPIIEKPFDPRRACDIALGLIDAGEEE